MKKYIWQYAAWPHLSWDSQALASLLLQCRREQGFLLGSANMLGFDLKLQAQGVILENEVLQTAAIEGEILNPDRVRSSVARRLGLPTGGMQPSDRRTDGLVEILLDAARHYNKHCSAERLKGWQAALFPDGYSGFHRIICGDWRQEEMEIVSGPEGRQRVHYRAPPPASVAGEMERFLCWLNNPGQEKEDGLTRAALAHYLFAVIHPFDDGNGRIARALTDMVLARDENTPVRFYSLSSQIMQERDNYYRVLEICSNGSGDITAWQEWFLGCFSRAVRSSQEQIERILVKARFWQEFAETDLNARQKKVVNRLLDTGKGRFTGNLAARNYRSLAKTTRATASRDLDDLVKKGVIQMLDGAGRNTRYDLVWERFETGAVGV